jgi:large subunit ribosomal protein L24
MPVDSSNVMLLTTAGTPTRVGYKVGVDGRRVRVARKTGETIDKK